MRPSLLDPLFSPVSAVGGIGPKTLPLFQKLLGSGRSLPVRVLDLLLHVPSHGIDRRVHSSIATAPLDQIVTVKVTVEEHRPPASTRARAPHRVLVGDETGDMQLAFFHGRSHALQQMLPVGAARWVSGRLELYDGMRQMTHPDRILAQDQIASLQAVEPVYPVTEGLTSRVVAKATAAALKRLPTLPEWLDPSVLLRRGWPTCVDAMRALHIPQDLSVYEEHAPARERLAYDELLASQLALVLVRAQAKRAAGRSTRGTGEARRQVLDRLGFELTDGQRAAISDIEADMASEQRMLRLLQGDVGSGKTIVGFMAMLIAVEAGRQAALMAPTEILARQHFQRLAPLAAAAGVTIRLLTGRDRPAERKEAREALAAGTIDIAVGTHALFQEGVSFRDLAIAIVDEQHRFGVQQRLALGSKGNGVDLLVMTATPIPRTLVLTVFGDMDVSILREKPAGRQPIDTRIVPIERLDDVVAALSRAVDAGQQAYWVAPLVEESDELDLTAAVERQAMLATVFGDTVGLLHGQMPGPEKDAAMAAFQRGDTRILVATTVIEVGVDVPNATIMVIEHAERFGLAQLHQLRGRVGRGRGKSTCLLLYKSPLGDTARARLETLRATEDGFLIAEKDLALRGEGDVLGTRQSGAPVFRIASLERHAELIAMARDDAVLIHQRDPELASPRGQALRVLLYLFERDAGIRLLRAG
jgi:ATP-dependent DNA helicase RecG